MEAVSNKFDSRSVMEFNPAVLAFSQDAEFDFIMY
jgi:hypothetical protein